MAGVRASARIVLANRAAGGLDVAMPSGTRSLLLQFQTPTGAVSVGAVITTTDGAPLSPGSAPVDVDLLCWADEAAKYVAPGREFSLWYGRTVGSGCVLTSGQGRDGA